MKLTLRKKHKKRIIKRIKQPLEVPSNPNVCWSMDFMSDILTDGRKLRVLNILDDCNREALAVDAGLSYPARALVETLDNLKEEVGVPKYIRCDNGPEFISKIFVNWCEKNYTETRYIQPGKPTQNAFVERLNGTYRRGVLDQYIFENIEPVRERTQEWMYDYNR